MDFSVAHSYSHAVNVNMVFGWHLQFGITCMICISWPFIKQQPYCETFKFLNIKDQYKLIFELKYISRALKWTRGQRIVPHTRTHVWSDFRNSGIPLSYQENSLWHYENSSFRSGTASQQESRMIQTLKQFLTLKNLFQYEILLSTDEKNTFS
jgi:hypothetical protein